MRYNPFRHRNTRVSFISTIMLSMNELRPGVAIEIDGEPYKVLEAHHQKIARRGSTLSAKLKHIKTGKVLERTFQPADRFVEPDVRHKPATFMYRTRDEFFFVFPSLPLF